MFRSYLPPFRSIRTRVLFTLFVFDYVYWCPTHNVLCFCFVCLRLVYSVSLHFQFVLPFGIHLSLFTCFNIGYGYLCMREIDVSFNKFLNQGIVHFKHKHV